MTGNHRTRLPHRLPRHRARNALARLLPLLLFAAVLATGAGPAPAARAADGWWDPVARPAPDSRIGVTGEPFRGTGPDGAVRGFVDAHNHLMSAEGFGGRVICGSAFSEQGVADALKDCPEHYPDGALALFENVTGGADGHHDPVGWPTFADWPAHDSLSHQQDYYAWVERAWRGGERVLVNDLVTNGLLCSIYPYKDRPCDEMAAIRAEAAKSYQLQDYVDRMYGGPGKGWFRIVTDSEQARAVVAQGRLAVVLGVETSEPFGCKQVLDVPQCDRAAIDRGLDELYALGVRSMFLCHKFDNALCGVRFDEGTTGVAVNAGQFLSTGTFWSTEQCTGPQHDNPIGLPTARANALLPAGVGLPVYAAAAQCNTRGLTALGAYAIDGLVKRHMMLEVDHMSAKAARSAFELLEAKGYPGVLSSHSWMDADWTERLYRLGGFAAQYPHDAAGFVAEADRTAALRAAYGVGYGYGSDLNGVGGWPGPVGPGAPTSVTYPFRSADGGSLLERQVTGDRTWDVNTDGLAHAGLLPDWIEQIRLAPGGQRVVDDLLRGAQSYLTTWRATELHGPGRELATGAAASASSSEWNPFTSYQPGRAVDGDRATRWASDWSDDQWLRLDLGAVHSVDRVTLDWERAHARSYRIEVSTDGTAWRTVWSTTAGDGGLDTAAFPPTAARYVRFHGTARATQWGYSLNEVSVHGT
ncbi:MULTISPECIES: discoidin domain-containing protein [Kitasatospora]|uniref:Putative sphingolipid ceramide N-deacylase n=1 Tax=Kitasatospora setae (strain ATCC 33774 / DSM 43861 / JCM 3304 / KCC A-0304 / NBRC 14216 / KM-6054) TaxID=452652 RepID=E4N1I9_KITSK|nr:MULTISPECIES: discoidin domain-containing protein [Kitasatospora]BAJ32023.1 putative sphingolipid ceramide N-deacylase [Kitasatospora setae KM-6054]